MYLSQGDVSKGGTHSPGIVFLDSSRQKPFFLPRSPELGTRLEVDLARVSKECAREIIWPGIEVCLALKDDIME